MCSLFRLRMGRFSQLCNGFERLWSSASNVTDYHCTLCISKIFWIQIIDISAIIKDENSNFETIIHEIYLENWPILILPPQKINFKKNELLWNRINNMQYVLKIYHHLHFCRAESSWRYWVWSFVFSVRTQFLETEKTNSQSEVAMSRIFQRWTLLTSYIFWWIAWIGIFYCESIVECFQGTLCHQTIRFEVEPLNKK